MSQLHQIYQCSVCHTVVETIHPWLDQGEVCHKPVLIQGKTHETGEEKHLPVITKTPSTIHVAIGSIPHPMEETHYIEWIEVIAGNRTYRIDLSPNDKPEADFPLIEGSITVRAFCNVHGLWITSIT